jgi:glucosamine--fructose-6-phosphate aminotransferase (isomerizing)
MSHLSQEIHEQPHVLTRLLDEQTEIAAQIAAAIRARDVRYAVIAARGTSDNAARYAQYLFGAVAGLPVALATPSLFSIYHTPPQLRDALVLGVSQSGQSPDIVAVVGEGRRQGALTVAVTNVPASPLAHAADYVLPLGAGRERAVAATKTYTAQLAALALLTVQLAGDGERLADLRSVPEAVEKTLALEEPIALAAQRYAYATECVVLGRGYNYATAFEIALKLKELTYIVAEPYSSADFRHGPVAIVERGFPAVVVAPQGAVYPDMLALARELAAPGKAAELIVISGEDEPLGLARTPLRLPVALPEWLSPFTCVVPGQLLALHVTLAKGYDPDHPRGLKKVTETR